MWTLAWPRRSRCRCPGLGSLCPATRSSASLAAQGALGGGVRRPRGSEPNRPCARNGGSRCSCARFAGLWRRGPSTFGRSDGAPGRPGSRPSRRDRPVGAWKKQHMQLRGQWGGRAHPAIKSGRPRFIERACRRYNRLILFGREAQSAATFDPNAPGRRLDELQSVSPGRKRRSRTLDDAKVDGLDAEC